MEGKELTSEQTKCCSQSKVKYHILEADILQ